MTTITFEIEYDEFGGALVSTKVHGTVGPDDFLLIGHSSLEHVARLVAAHVESGGRLGAEQQKILATVRDCARRLSAIVGANGDYAPRDPSSNVGRA